VLLISAPAQPGTGTESNSVRQQGDARAHTWAQIGSSSTTTDDPLGSLVSIGNAGSLGDLSHLKPSINHHEPLHIMMKILS
jgi:hypothetical protein